MASFSRTDRTAAQAPQNTGLDRYTDFEDIGNEPKPAKDWKKIGLIVGLGALSWVATYVGMLELIQANMGDLPLHQKAIIGCAVAMLMLMIIWLLDQLFAHHNLITKLSYFGGYLFLTLISVGFGFGFYWKVLESRSESTRSAESAITQVQSGLYGASTRLTQLQATLESLAVISAGKAVEERTKGTSCPNSRPGDGPRRKLRDDDAARFSYSSEFVRGRAGAIKNDVKALDGDLQKVVKGAKSTFDAKSGTRNDFMRAIGRKLNLTVTGFNAFRTDPQLRQIRADLADRAGRTVFPDSRGGSFSCPDAQLQTALRGVVRAIDQLPVLVKPKIAAVEGSEAVIEAFRRLAATLYGAIQLKLPPSADELRALQQKAVQSVESPGSAAAVIDMDGAGLSKRDFIPLAIAMFVDLCLLLVSIGRPLNPFQGMAFNMRQAEKGPMYKILARFGRIHRDPEIIKEFEFLRHVIFDFGGMYYGAVPLDAPPRMNPAERERLRAEIFKISNYFTSFEQDKVFSRVLTPVLTKGMIQKRLRLQGSKFAEAEAFRTYKFRDGGYSKMLLHSIMGAAVQVHSERRLHQTQAEPALEFDGRPPSAPVRRPQSAIRLPDPEPGQVAPSAARLSGQGEGDNLAASHSAANGFHSPAPNGSYTNGATSGHAANGNAANGTAANGTAASGHATGSQVANGAGAMRSAARDTQAHERLANGFGRYATAAEAELVRPNSRRHRAGSEIADDHEAAGTGPEPGAIGSSSGDETTDGENGGLPNVIRLAGARGAAGGRKMANQPAPEKYDDIHVEAHDPAPPKAMERAAVTAPSAPVITEAAPVLHNLEDNAQGRVNVELRERRLTYSIPGQDGDSAADLLRAAQRVGTLAARTIDPAEPRQAELQLEAPAVNEPEPSASTSLAEAQPRPDAIIDLAANAADDHDHDGAVATGSVDVVDSKVNADQREDDASFDNRAAELFRRFAADTKDR